MLLEICVMRQLRDPMKVSCLTSIEDRRGFLSCGQYKAPSEERTEKMSKPTLMTDETARRPLCGRKIRCSIVPDIN